MNVYLVTINYGILDGRGELNESVVIPMEGKDKKDAEKNALNEFKSTRFYSTTNLVIGNIFSFIMPIVDNTNNLYR